MFGISTIKTKDLDRLREEAKGYYGQTQLAYNEYLETIKSQLRGLDLVLSPSSPGSR